MDGPTIISTLALTIGAAWCSGINLYATVAVLGLLHRYTSFDLPAGMEPVANAWVLIPAIVMFCVEFVADKVPAVDSAWDVVQTFVRVPAGAVLAAMAIGDVPVEFQLLALLLGGGLAFGAHATKMAARLATHSTGTSPVLGPVISVAEDAAVVGTVTLAAMHPLVALGILAVMIVAAYFLFMGIYRLARRAFMAMRGFWRRGDTELVAE